MVSEKVQASPDLDLIKQVKQAVPLAGAEHPEEPHAVRWSDGRVLGGARRPKQA
jgi:hypothetical protein